MQLDVERYNRQIILQEFGKENQEKLFNAKILIVGAGGLGCPALLYLAAAGIGTIGIADNDLVNLSNLHRQVLFTVDDINKPKVLVAANRLKQLNPDINIVAHQTKITNKNALEIIKQYDIIIDGTDNFPSKYLLNDACVLLNKPLVYGAVSKFEGQVAIFNAGENIDKCNYRDIFPEPPTEEILNCAEAGVLGVVCGIIGIMQANETIKLICNIGNAIINRMYIFNALTTESYTINLTKNKNNNRKITENEFIKLNYELVCDANNIKQIDEKMFHQMLTDKTALFVDVREAGELPEVSFQHTKIPLSIFDEACKNIDADKIIFFCKTGSRSLRAAQKLSVIKKNKIIFSLKGGIERFV